MQTVDLFAGAGGFSTGAQQAGAQIVWAANHWAAAVQCHTINHPTTAHVCQDLHLYPSINIPDHTLLLASPSCKGFSPARGKHQKHHDAHRATAWVVIDVAEAKRPQYLIVENVPEMRKWALYGIWCQALRHLGYTLTEHIIDAAAVGVPQNRVRLFVVGTLAKKPVRFTLPVGTPTPIAGVLAWGKGRWSRIYKPRRAANTLARIARSTADGLGPRFLIPYYGATKTGRALNRPIGTLTTKPRYALVDTQRGVMRMLSVDEAKAAMGFPGNYALPQKSDTANMLLGNAVCPPVARFLVKQIMRHAA